MTVTAFFTNKGGVGKTTAACNFAHALSERGQNVLVIDADPQCNASTMLLGEGYLDHKPTDFVNGRPKRLEGWTTMEDVITPVRNGEGYIRDEHINVAVSENFGVCVIPAHPVISLSEDMLGGDWSRAKGGDIRGVNTTLFLRNLVERLRGNYDEIVIDCGPSFSPLTRSALLASDEFVSPIGNDVFSLHALRNQATWLKRLDSDVHGIRRVLDERDVGEMAYVRIPHFRGVVTRDKEFGIAHDFRAAAQDLAALSNADRDGEISIRAGNISSLPRQASRSLSMGVPLSETADTFREEFAGMVTVLRPHLPSDEPTLRM